MLTEQCSEKRGEALRVCHALDRSGKSQSASPMRVLECIDKLSAEYFAKNRDRQKERAWRVNPTRVIRRETSAGNDTVDVRMEQEVLSPRVKDSEEADLGAQMFWIGRDL